MRRSFTLLVFSAAAGCFTLETSDSGTASGDGLRSPPAPPATATATPGDRIQDAATDGPAAAGDGSAHDAGAIIDAGDGGDGAPPRFVPAYYDVNHVLSTGQSLSVGSQGTTILSTAQPFFNLMPNTGVRGPATAAQADFTSFVPLVEANVETMGSGLANLATELAETTELLGLPAPQDKHVILVSGHGVGGRAYAALKKGGTEPAYANGLKQVSEAKRLADADGKSYVVRVVTNVHGESDHVAKNTNYAQNLVEWQQNYEDDVKAITGQTGTLPMLHTQFSSWTKYSTATSAVVIAQLQASVDHPDAIPLVGPKYFLPYVADGVHLTSEGYRWMGEYYAKVYRQIVIQGRRWEPLRPVAAVSAGVEILVTFHVPAPPLVLDTTSITDPGNYGFEYTDDSGAPPAITAVALTSPTTVKITLASEPTGGGKRVRYAYTGVIGARAGTTSGPRGNLRDSDATVSRSGKPLQNWAVHFDFAVP